MRDICRFAVRAVAFLGVPLSALSGSAERGVCETIAPCVRPVAFSRDRAITFGLTNGVYTFRHEGKTDWAVSAFPVVKTRGGDRFSLSLDVARADGNPVKGSVILRYADGEVNWAYAAQAFRRPGTETWSFAIPEGATSFQARFGGVGVCTGIVRRAALTRLEPLPPAEAPQSLTLESAELKVRVGKTGGGLLGRRRKDVDLA